MLNATTATKEDAAKLYRVAIQDAIVRWQTETECDNSDTQLLAFCLRIGLLPNRISQLRRIEPLVSRYRELEAQVSIPTRVPTLEETSGRSQPLYVRGDHRLPAENVMPRFLEAIDSAEYKPEVKARVQLAKDLIRDDNPLTRRVIANRIWHHLLGKGIVSTPDNLGRMGTEPSHPELLDWLANQLREQSWSLKSLIRMIVTSETWQQSSTPSPMATDTDPNNQWLSHANLRRLDAEVIRDSLLASSDQLDTTLLVNLWVMKHIDAVSTFALSGIGLTHSFECLTTLNPFLRQAVEILRMFPHSPSLFSTIHSLSNPHPR